MTVAKGRQKKIYFPFNVLKEGFQCCLHILDGKVCYREFEESCPVACDENSLPLCLFFDSGCTIPGDFIRVVFYIDLLAILDFYHFTHSKWEDPKSQFLKNSFILIKSLTSKPYRWALLTPPLKNYQNSIIQKISFFQINSLPQRLQKIQKSD